MAMMNGAAGAGDNGRGDPEAMVEINTTPLIDVMLVLLIMLIITIPIQLHSVTLDAPSVRQAPPPTPPVVVTVDIEAEGLVRWNGEALADRAVLEERLRQAAVAPDAPEVHIKPDPQAAYKHVAAVLAAAQRQGVAKLAVVDRKAAGG